MMKSLAAIAVIIASLSVAYYYVYYLPKNSERTAQLIEKTNLDLQEKCSRQARTVYERSKGNGNTISGSTNHYHGKLNKCFMLETHANCTSSVCIDFRTLTDAFEGKTYGSYLKSMPRDKNSSETPIFSCYVNYPEGEKTCSSPKEFDELASYYMQ